MIWGLHESGQEYMLVSLLKGGPLSVFVVKGCVGFPKVGAVVTAPA